MERRILLRGLSQRGLIASLIEPMRIPNGWVVMTGDRPLQGQRRWEIEASAHSVALGTCQPPVQFRIGPYMAAFDPDGPEGAVTLASNTTQGGRVLGCLFQ